MYLWPLYVKFINACNQRIGKFIEADSIEFCEIPVL